MKIKDATLLINLAKLKKGGGQNVALNFLNGLNKSEYKKNHFIFIVAIGSAAHTWMVNNSEYKYFVAPQNPMKCILWEMLFSYRTLPKLGVNVIYTYFGYSSFVFSNIPQVTGSADSNLFYPEIDFWYGESKLKRVYRNLVDLYRIRGLANSKAVIFENPDMLKRGAELFKLKNTKLVKPSIVDFEVSNVDPNEFIFDKKNINILLLCGWQRNKGILIIPRVAALAKKYGIKLHFIITAGNSKNGLSDEFNLLIEKLRVESMISIIEPVNKEKLKTLYMNIDFVFLLSKLESFSNNIIEAWFYKKPLVVADEPWARSICKVSAIYVNRDSEEDIFSKLTKHISDKKLNDIIINNASSELTTYPNIHERISEELSYVCRFAQNT
jgi:glycosyltransferase involved in cell wall biosynthesis